MWADIDFCAKSDEILVSPFNVSPARKKENAVDVARNKITADSRT